MAGNLWAASGEWPVVTLMTHDSFAVSDELLASEFYNIKSNDIIYVEPLKSKKWGMDTFPYDLLLSVASLTIVVLTFFITYLN